MHDSSDSEAGAFWAFSLGLYRADGVERAVLSLQDQHGADVNVLFWCVWAAAAGRGRLQAADFRRAEAVLEEWRREVTLPLRRIRDRIKALPSLSHPAGAGECRAKVLAAEVESERVAQTLLEGLTPAEAAPEADPPVDASASLRAYAAHLSIDLREAKAPLLVVLHAAFPARAGGGLGSAPIG